jgi:chemotaxis signal transduction protein
MTDQPSNVAGEMRRAFDRAFAMKPVPVNLDAEDFIAVRAGDQLLALRASEIRMVLRCPRITPLPGRSEALLGISAVRVGIVGMYSLSALVSGSRNGAPGRWVALCGDRSVGLVFDELQGYARIERRSIHLTRNAEAPEIADEVVTFGESARPVIDVTNLLVRINAKGQDPREQKE